MPVSRRSFLPGNYTHEPDFSVGEAADNIFPGFAGFCYRGHARVTTTTSGVLAIANRADLAPVIPASAADPAWVTHLSFYIPPYSSSNPNEYGSNTITAGTTDVIKLATAATVDAAAITTASAVSGAAAAGVVPSGEWISIIEPGTPVKLTADTTFQLHSSTAAGGAGVAGGNIRVATGWFWIPVKIHYCKKMRAPSITDILFSDTQLRINADV